jgi:outer membrane protein OmpA-like peptidoglycan-associated protein
MGGYDVFYSVIQPDGTCSEPKNMGYPINTPDDDLYFTMSGSGLHGYFSSVRPEGKGDKDIYLIDFTETISPMNIASVTLIKGEVRDSTTGQPIEAEIEITDNVKNELVAIFTSNSVTGEYLISLPSGKNYGITLKAKDCLFHSENFDIPESAAFSEVTMNVVLNKINVGSRVVLRNIFFNYASDVIRGESFSELERMYLLLKENPNMRIEISGHTDNQSSMETNMKLSTARAKAVVEYLVNKGIDPKQMESKGYAYTQPIASNDTEEGKKQNRRVEYKILSK